MNKGLGIFLGIEFKKLRNLLRVWGVYSLISPRIPPPFWDLSPEGYLIEVIEPPTALLMVDRGVREPVCAEDKPGTAKEGEVRPSTGSGKLLSSCKGGPISFVGFDRRRDTGLGRAAGLLFVWADYGLLLLLTPDLNDHQDYLQRD